MTDNAMLIEDSLALLAGQEDSLRGQLFERFFEAFPNRRAIFYNLDVSSRRMADETLQMMLGLARGENWVWPLVSELTFTHRNYGYLPLGEYDAFVDIVVDMMREGSGEAWSPTIEAEWQKQGTALKAMIATAKAGWSEAMPGEVLETNSR